ncbi:conserved hypothetical protein [Clostridioides difficile]|uniref:Uncharacterized protein n=1 Tax=Clostridioides difficile TaxID=1496 RepID=A0A069A8D8_CLODI|nr:conserved hypothetical protein [Clostridioides difficile]CDS87272.1 conserved hypothetical protein [Clostridioides difficile]
MSLSRFILTKWYVNFLIIMSSPSVTLCFILTKWYVNHIGVEAVSKALKGFILTKWYVNVAYCLAS